MKVNDNLTRLLRIYFLLIGLVIWCAQLNAQSLLNHSLWKESNLLKVPAFKIISHDSAIGLLYQGLIYQGHKQDVFAYYATPGTISGNPAMDKNLPAIVLVHGGGGMAFKQWAMDWAKRGYAAIAMDLRGNGADRKHIVNGFVEPNNQTPYFDVSIPLKDQWMYQAVGDIFLANNLIRSFKEIDTSKVAITGISWGGVLSCIVASLDNRYKVAVPVYGCGYLNESGKMKTQLDALNPDYKNTWLHQYDPSHYLQMAKMPMLFLNDANDPYFELPSYIKTYDLVKSDKNICIKIGLKHSHHAGWSNEEIYYFINHIINNTPGLEKITQVKQAGNKISFEVYPYTAVSHSGLSLFLNYSTNSTDSGIKRKWITTSINARKGKYYFTHLPKGAAVWYISVIDKRGLTTSSEVRFTN